MKKFLIIIAALLFALPANAQVFSQNQVINAPYGGFVYSPNTSVGSKLLSTTTPFFSAFAFGTATGTSATTTNFNVGNFTGASLTSCSSASNALTWSGGQFGCNTISGGGGSTFGNTFNFVQASPTNYLQPTTTATGLLITASSTIGDSLNGLTIYGQSTTTGNAYFANRVGINTQAPLNKLDVKVFTNEHIQFSTGSVSGGTSLYSGTDADAYAPLQIDGSSLLLNTRSGGNVGISTTTPTAKFEVYDNTNGGTIKVTRDAGSNRGQYEFGLSGAGLITSELNGTSDSTSVNNGILTFSNSNGSGVLTENMRIMGSNGDTGIATTTPLSRLTVGGNASIGTDYNIAAPANGLIVEGNTGIGSSTPGSPLSVLKVGITNLDILALTNNQGGANDKVNIHFYDGGGTGGTIGYERQNSASGDLTFDVSPTFNGALAEAMRITATGRIGIATTTPATLLDIFGTSPSIRIEDSVANTGATNWGINTDQGNFWGTLDFMTSSVQRGVPLTKAMEISSTSGVAIGSSYAGTNLPPTNGLIVQGNVGIGASTPTEPLTITESVSTDSGLIVTNGAGGAAALKVRNGNTGGREYDLFSTGSSDGSTGAGDFDIFDASGGGSRIVITSTGNVGISTTTPSANFAVQGNELISGTSTVGNLFATSTITISPLGIAAGSFLAVNPQGLVIATTTPATTITSGTSQPVKYATTVALPSNTYLAGVITEVGTGALSVDGSSPAVADRVLVKNEATAANNGIYTVTAAGSGIAAFVLTRAADYNSSTNIYPGIATYVISGSTLADDWWAMTSAAPITVGTTALNYTESSGGVLSPGTGISISGTTISVNQTFTPVWSGLHTFTGGILGNNATSTITNLTMVNATSTFGTTTNEFVMNASTTNATTTNFFSANASTTSFRSNTGTIGALTVNSCTGCGGGTTPTAKTLVLEPNYNLGAQSNGLSLNANTTAHVGQVVIPFQITANKLSIPINSVTTAGTIKVGLYSEDGQTQIFTVTTGTISTGANVVTTIGPVTIPAGIYYIVVVPVGTANILALSYTQDGQSNAMNNTTGKPVLEGTLSVTASTLPTTFTPSSITSVTINTLIARLDN